jgi:hypothetical protein
MIPVPWKIPVRAANVRAQKTFVMIKTLVPPTVVNLPPDVRTPRYLAVV